MITELIVGKYYKLDIKAFRDYDRNFGGINLEDIVVLEKERKCLYYSHKEDRNWGAYFEGQTQYNIEKYRKVHEKMWLYSKDALQFFELVNSYIQEEFDV